MRQQTKSSKRPTLNDKATQAALAKRKLASFKRVLHQHLPELREQYGVKSLGIFGSYVRGEARKRSDLDVLVEFGDKPLSLWGFIGLQNHLSDLLGVKVDLVERQMLKPVIGERILAEVVLL